MTIEDAGRRAGSPSTCAPAPGARPDDEAALVAAVAERLERARPGRPELAPPITHLGTVAAGVAATAPGALRAPGRPLGVVLAEAGFETHLGWVGPAGTEWSSLTEEEIDALECDVADLLAAERTAEAALAQGRLLTVLRRHVPERVPAARRHLARILARAGRFDQALAQLRAAFSQADPEDWYEASLIAYRHGDERSARRWVESGLAHADGPERAEVAECLADIGDDLDAQAAFLRARALLDDAEALFDEEGPERIARAIVGLRRSYLIEAMVEEILAIAPGRRGRRAPGRAGRRRRPGARGVPGDRGDPASGPRPRGRRGGGPVGSGARSRPSRASPTRAPPPRGRPRPSTPPISSRSSSRSPRSAGASLRSSC